MTRNFIECPDVIGPSHTIWFTPSAPTGSDDVGVFYRYDDVNDYVAAYLTFESGAWRLKRESGLGVGSTFTLDATTAIVPGDTVRIDCVGNAYSFYVNGVLKYSETLALEGGYAYRAGLYANAASPVQLDNFYIGALGTIPPTGSPAWNNAARGLREAAVATCSFRFELTDRGGARIGELSVARDAPGTLTVDTGSSMKRTLRSVLLPLGELRDIDLIRDRVRLTMILNGVDKPLGLYMFTSPSEEALTSPVLDSGTSFAHLDFVDQLLIVTQATTRAYSLTPGQNITDFLVDFLSTLPVTVDIAPSSQVVGTEALTWPPATSGLAIVNQLATMLGYHELYFANDERGKLFPMPDPELVSDDVLRAATVKRPSVTRENSLLDTPNRFIVVGSGSTDAPIVGVYDVPADAPHSFVNRGYYVTYSEQQQGVASVSQAGDAAQALARQRSFAYETLNYSTPIDPEHDHYDIVEVERVRFLEVGWSFPLRCGAEMTHVARRTYAL